MRLDHILTDLTVIETIGEPKAMFKRIIFDSRKVEKGDCFVAVKGLHSDGHAFIDGAVEKGAQVVVCQTLPDALQESVTYLKVADSAEAMGILASNFYGRPSRKLKLVGVTGTNGKTTTATLLYKLYQSLGYKAGLLSTVENRIGQRVYPTTFTTPDAVALNELLAEMVEAGCEFAFMEVSSHAVHQRRIAGLYFAGGIFTNLTHDHLDYHGSFREYLHAKKRFFDELPSESFALTNMDDRNGEVMLQNTKAKKYRYSLRVLTDFKAKIIENSLSGLHLEIDRQEFYGRLIGEFNAYNLLAVYATARLLEAEPIEVLTALSQVRSAKGRFEYIFDKHRKITGIVDYAHTPDALLKVLTTIRQLRKGEERVITVVGCGGDRDKAKRPLMAKIACEHSDQLILTSDNPRSEDPDVIIGDMEEGLSDACTIKTLSITNRRQAIRTACRLAQTGDIVLVAGKGHETYQEIKGVRHSFDDKVELENALKGI
ncbi:MAG: UDP-N-acetylmuramoyl-L-alanyl-D-glutamate--2,6-diaminopimelate ligase [Bacteroidota bacterium]